MKELNKIEREVIVRKNDIEIEGILGLPPGAQGIVIFAHGSGSSRFSPRNTYVARVLQKAKIGTFLVDLLSEDEERRRENVFDIHLLSDRLILAKNWLLSQEETKDLTVGYFGASTGAGAAVMAAAKDPKNIQAVVSRGGRPDLAGNALEEVESPTLLIVGGDDDVVLDLNRAALQKMSCTKELKIISGATHLFEEPGTLETVAELASDWFQKYLTPPRSVLKKTQRRIRKW